MRASRGESGQMAVELAIVLPLVLVVFVIALDCMVFMGECARFDHIACQRVLALGVSPAKDGYGADARVESVRAALAGEFDAHGERVEVSCSRADGAGGVAVYELGLSMPLWPLGGTTLFGTGMPSLLQHRFRFAVDPYTPGEL